MVIKYFAVIKMMNFVNDLDIVVFKVAYLNSHLVILKGLTI